MNKILPLRVIDNRIKLLAISNKINYNPILSNIENTIKFASNTIKSKNLPIVKYDLLFSKIREYKVQIAELMGMDQNKECSIDELREVFCEFCDKNIGEQIIEIEISEQTETTQEGNSSSFVLTSENKVEFMALLERLWEDLNMIEYKNELIGFVNRKRRVENANYNQYKQIEDLQKWLNRFVEVDISERELFSEIDDYNPPKEAKLENYILKGNAIKIDSILREELLNSCNLRSGLKIATILKSIEMCDCRFNTDTDLKSFYTNILVGKYGVTVSYEGFRRPYQGTAVQQAKAIENAKQRSEAYREKLE